MRRSWLCPLAALLFAGVAAADHPFEGTWKVLLPQPPIRSEVNLWLIKVDKAGKAVEVAAGVSPDYKAAALKDAKVSDKGLSFTLAVPRRETFHFAFLPPPKDDRETSRGSARVISPTGPGVTAAWLEKTELAEIDPKLALQKVGALGDLEAALKKADADDRLKGLADVARNHLGRPVGMLAHTSVLSELGRTKAKPAAWKEAIASYMETSKLFGPQLLLAHRMQMANALRGNKETQELSLENAREAVKLLDDDQPKEQHFNAYLSLTTTLAVMERKDEVEPLLPKIKGLVEAIVEGMPADQKGNATLALAGPMLQSPAAGVADLGLEYARSAHAGLEKDAPPLRRLTFDKFLRDALLARNQKDEAEKMTAAIDKTEAELDAAFEKGNVPFEVKPFAGRAGKSRRAVLVELFTGAQAVPAVSADVAFAAARKAYGPTDVVLMQYHMHAPFPDALTNADGEARQRYYAAETGGKVPAALLDGQPGPELGGGRAQAADRYSDLVKGLNSLLEEEAGAAIELTAKRKGSKVEMAAEVSGLKAPGKNLRLRFVLVEEVVRYPGVNGQRLHPHVVRSFPGGVSGLALGKDGRHTATADLEEVRESLTAYLKAFQAKARVQFRELPLGLKKLKVVAFVQDDDTKKVLQAAQVDVE